ncbi:hypothetical protein [Lysinibacillus sp. RS5]
MSEVRMQPDALFICAKAKRQRQMFSVAKAKRQLQLHQGEIDKNWVSRK